jgi:hypothetical protein
MQSRWAHVVLVVALSIVPAASVARGDDLADLKATHLGALQAMAAGNVEAWLAVFHGENVRVYANSPIPMDYKGVDRAALRRDLEASFAGNESYTLVPVNLQYRVIGDTGIVWGYHVDVVRKKEGPGSATLNQITAVYARVGGKWLRVCTHISPVPREN